jgi:hypothetical protein
MKFYIPFLIAILSFLNPPYVAAQIISSKVVDKKTKEGVPYATVQFSDNDGTVTNEEGRFSVDLKAAKTEQDSIYISCMGYERTGFSIARELDSILYLNPKPIELSGVYLFDHELNVEDIIEKVKERLPYNYNKDLIKQRLFLRHSEYNKLRKLNVHFKESTIEELSKKFIDSVVSILPRGANYFTESLIDYYRSPEENRLHIEKAAELYDKNNEGSMEALSKKLEKIFKDNVKPNSYLKIKSGLFGQKVQVDSILAASDEASELKDEVQEPKKNYFLSYKKKQLDGLYSELFYTEDTKLNFIRKSGRYDFSLNGYTEIDEAGVYVIDFEPKRREDFKGTIFVNMEDFAVVRIEYTNVNSLRRIRLLGFSYEETVYRGTTIFAKGANAKYDLRFIEKVEERVMGVDRPLKVIEKNKFVKGRRKQNELSLGIDVINHNTKKYELVVFGSESISSSEFSGVEENDTVQATYLSRYSPEFWKGYNIMEPNAAIREFAASGE